MSKNATGKVQYNAAIDADLASRWKEWVARQPGGFNLAQHTEMALERHMAHPPMMPHETPLPPMVLPCVPPLPDAPVAPPVAEKPKRGRKPKAG